MDFKDIKRIVELMDEHGLTQFKLEQNESKLELKKGGDFDVKLVQQMMASAGSGPMYHHAAHAPAAGGPAPAAPVAEGGLPVGSVEITSPMVGTFYAAPSPDSPPFVKVGDRVTADTTVCIIEAMKVMNEIKADVSGEITAVLIEAGTPVQYGEPLFHVKAG